MTMTAALATLAGAVGLYPLFETAGWFAAGLGAVLAVAAGGLIARRLRLPAALQPLATLLALLLCLNLVYAGPESLLGVVPTPESLGRLLDLADGGWASANRYAAPVPVLPGIGLLTAAGIGLVAVLVDFLAVGLRRAAPAGLPLLAMYSVPAAVRDDGIGWLPFAVGALGFLALLMADSREQVGGWGPLVARRRWSAPRDPADAEAADAALPASLAAAATSGGRRIALGAVAVAVLLPTAVPGLQERGILDLRGGSGGDTRTVTTPDPLVSLKRELTRLDDSTVLTYRTEDPIGPGYLRLYALDRFDGDRWTYSPMSTRDTDRLREGEPLPDPPGLTTGASRRVTTQVSVREEVRDMSFLPLPYAPERVAIDGDWRADPESLMVYSLRDSASGRTYTVQSRIPQPSGDELEDSDGYSARIVRRYTELPRGIPDEVRTLTRNVAAGASTAHDQAVLLQRWFTETGGYAYDLSAPAPKRRSDLVDFLLHSKRGYCEQFAASMALMARILGIPARVAMGYTAGVQTGPDEWTVRSRDAHAWPELYFPGSGWVRFEPTPSGIQGQGTATAPSYSTPETSSGVGTGSDSSSAEDSGSSAAEESAAPQNPRQDPGAGNPGDAAAGQEAADDGFRAAPWLAGGLVALLALAVPAVARVIARRRRWAALTGNGTGPDDSAGDGPPGPSGGRPAAPGEADRRDPATAAHAAWRELRADALDHGLEWRAGDSPRAAARRLGELLELDPAGTQALRRIARAEELARYSRRRSAEPPERLRADVRTVREAVAAAAGRRARLRARLLPPSTLAEARGTLRSAGDRVTALADRPDGPVARLRALGERVRRG
ncbi:transglutaminase domain-containing protein [Actinomadura sp. WMMB 499]|nr:transglutaminase domain-containing protein [Actinomadura sp. WMMB 499]